MASGWHNRRTTPADAERKRQYNSREHKQGRKAGQRQVDAGVAYCWRCGMWLPPGSAWHLGHDDYDRTVYRGPECPPCNVKAASHKANRMAAERRSGAHTGRTNGRRTRMW